MNTAHLIYLGGEFLWQHWRAVETAKVHGGPVIVWHASEPESEHWDALHWIEKRPLELPDWLRDHPIQLANVKDLYAWRILHDHGGIYLDLDTVSLRPAWDLLTRDVCVSLECEGGDCPHPYNSAAVLGRKGAAVLDVLHGRALAVLKGQEARWGKCGPHLLTDAVRDYPYAFDVAPFNTLNGMQEQRIRDYYLNGKRPDADARVLHLYSSNEPELFRADRWMPS
jgi:hypothetical protein